MKAVLKIAFWAVPAMFVNSMFGDSLGMVDRFMALQRGCLEHHPLSVWVHHFPALYGCFFRFSLLVVNTLITP